MRKEQKRYVCTLPLLTVLTYNEGFVKIQTTAWLRDHVSVMLTHFAFDSVRKYAAKRFAPPCSSSRV